MTLNNKVTRLAKYYSLINYNYIFNNKAINRYKQSQKILNNNSKNAALEILKKNIEKKKKIYIYTLLSSFFIFVFLSIPSQVLSIRIKLIQKI